MKAHRVKIGSQHFLARHGEILLDAAILSGVDIPHDCRAGVCGTCRLAVVDGHIQPMDNGFVHACQARVTSHVALELDEARGPETRFGRVEAVESLAPDVIEVVIALKKPIAHQPGQYFRVQFRGFPDRCYSPTVPLDRVGDARRIHLHIRRLTEGRVSSALLRDIVAGHRVRLHGPFGSAFLRSHSSNRLVLAASGTGFAPIWSIADAAMRDDFHRELVLVVGARNIESLYMIPALWRLAHCPNATVVPVIKTRQHVNPLLRHGSVVEHLPHLRADDAVYAAGAPHLVNTIEAIARSAGAACYADRFLPSQDQSRLTQFKGWLLGVHGRSAQGESHLVR